MISPTTAKIKRLDTHLSQKRRPFRPRIVCGPLVLLLLLTVLSSVSFAAGEQTEELLRQAEKLYEQLEYEQALKTLIQVQQAPDLTPIQRARTYLYMGVAFTALGRAENAVQAFMEVLKLRPKFRLPPGVSPSIRAMFGQALKRLNLPDSAPGEAAEGAAPAAAGAPAGGQQPSPQAGGASSGVDISARAPRTVLAGKPIPIQIQIDDPKRQVRELVIRWRRRNDPDYSTIRLTYAPGSTKAKGVIPGAAIGEQKGRLLYYVEARDSEGNMLARSGDEEEPRHVSLNVPKGKKKEGGSTWHWWALGIGGAAAAIAGGVLAAALLSDGGGDQAKLSVVIK